MVADYLPLLAQGAGLSLCVMLLSLAVALVLGLINAVIKLFGPRWLRWISTGYTTLVRGIPELVIMLLLFFGGEMLVNGFFGLLGLGPVRFNTFVSGVLAIGIVFGAYYTETFRGAFQTVERGQLEAAVAYGMRPRQVFWRIMLPQMLSFAIPGINNNWLGLMKASALISILGLEDMVWLAEQAGRATQKLAGHAVLPVKSTVAAPADAPTDLQQSGKYTSGQRVSTLGAVAGKSADRPTGIGLPITGQPLQGHSGIKHMPDGTYWVLTDNGFGSKANSPDAMLYLNHYDIDFKNGSATPLQTNGFTLFQMNEELSGQDAQIVRRACAISHIRYAAGKITMNVKGRESLFPILLREFCLTVVLQQAQNSRSAIG